MVINTAHALDLRKKKAMFQNVNSKGFRTIFNYVLCSVKDYTIDTFDHNKWCFLNTCLYNFSMHLQHLNSAFSVLFLSHTSHTFNITSSFVLMNYKSHLAY